MSVRTSIPIGRPNTRFDSSACSQLTKKSRKAVSRDVAAVSVEWLHFFWRHLLPRAANPHIFYKVDSTNSRCWRDGRLANLGFRSSSSLRPLRREKNPRFSGRRNREIRETRRTIYVARSRSPTLGSARWGTHLTGTGNDCFVYPSACSKNSRRREHPFAAGTKGLVCACDGDGCRRALGVGAGNEIRIKIKISGPPVYTSVWMLQGARITATFCHFFDGSGACSGRGAFTAS